MEQVLPHPLSSLSPTSPWSYVRDLYFEYLKTNHPHCLLTVSREVYLQCAPILYSTHITLTASNVDAFFQGVSGTPETFSYGDIPKDYRRRLSRRDRFKQPAVWFSEPRARKYYLSGFVERLTVAEAAAVLRLIEAGRLFAAVEIEGADELVPDELGVAPLYIFPRLRSFEHGPASLKRMKNNGPSGRT